LDLVKATTTPTDIDFAVKAIKTPAKTQLGAIVVNDDIIKAVLSGGDVVDEWNAIREGYKGFGIEQAIKEVNEAAAKK